MLTPSNHIPQTTYHCLFQTSRRIVVLYFLIVTIVVSIIASLPFLYVDISVVAPGIVRPSDERTEVKAATSGFIGLLKYREGDFVRKDSLLAALQQHHLTAKRIQLSGRISELRKYITDVRTLLTPHFFEHSNIQAIKTQLYRQQFLAFKHRLAEQQLLLHSSEEELRINRYLNAEKVISPKELFDKQTAHNKLDLARISLHTAQRLIWQEALIDLQSEYNQLLSEQKQLSLSTRDHQLTAPVSGSLQYVSTRYPGSYLQAGETLCIISPESQLLAECIVSAKDIALVKASRKVTFRFDAFNYSYFGIVTGKILSIDKDFTLIDNKPVFKVRCHFNELALPLSNGFTGKIQKGLTLQASFKLTRRSLWQLLYDTVDDWINPNNENVK
jgi:HlyD family secretion protein